MQCIIDVHFSANSAFRHAPLGASLSTSSEGDCTPSCHNIHAYDIVNEPVTVHCPVFPFHSHKPSLRHIYQYTNSLTYNPTLEGVYIYLLVVCARMSILRHFMRRTDYIHRHMSLHTPLPRKSVMLEHVHQTPMQVQTVSDLSQPVLPWHQPQVGGGNQKTLSADIVRQYIPVGLRDSPLFDDFCNFKYVNYGEYAINANADTGMVTCAIPLTILASYLSVTELRTAYAYHRIQYATKASAKTLCQLANSHFCGPLCSHYCITLRGVP